MFTLGQFLAFCAASVILIVIPGPSVMFVVGRALAYGRRTALWTAFGNAAGAFAAAVVVAVGMGQVIQQSAFAFAVVKYAGAAYLVFLGVKALRERGGIEVPGADETRPVRTALPVFEGFLVGMLNPKTILFFLAILPQFVDPTVGSATVQMLVLGGVFAALAAMCDSVWATVAASARNVLRAPRARRNLNLVGGASMIGLGVAAAGERA